MATPLNDIIRSVTTAYLSDIDPDDPPFPEDVERDLLEAVNRQITSENSTQTSRERLPVLKILTHGQNADIMMRLHHIVRIAADRKAPAERGQLAMYAPLGPNEGIYLTSEDAFRLMARRYNYSMTTKDFKEVLATLQDRAPRVLPTAYGDLVPVANGVFNYETKELLPFNWKYIFTSKSDTPYVPDAPNPVIHNEEDGSDWDAESWMSSLSDDPEIVDLSWCAISACVRGKVK